MQYGFVAFFSAAQAGANPTSAMVATLNARAVLSPLGHGTWTGILAAVIWYERSAGRHPLGGRVWVTYVGVSLLHALFDIAASSSVGPTPLPFSHGGEVSIFAILLGLLGFLAIVGIVRLGRRGRDPVAAFFDRAGKLAAAARTQQQQQYYYQQQYYQQQQFHPGPYPPYPYPYPGPPAPQGAPQ
jgi:protease prsW family protein